MQKTQNKTAGNWECEDLNVALSQINAACHPPVCSVQFNLLELDLLSHSGIQFGHTPYLSFVEPNSPALKWTATKVCFKHFFNYYYWSVYRFWSLINWNNPLERILHFFFLIRKLGFWKVQTQRPHKNVLQSQFKSNSNHPASAWRGLQLHRKWLAGTKTRTRWLYGAI